MIRKLSAMVGNISTTADMMNSTEMWANVTTEAPSGEDIPTYWGFIAASVSVVMFGSNFIPVKKFETGDGMFFQWVMCVIIWVVGLVVNIIQQFPPFYPLCMLGGFLWCTGNTMTVLIIKTIGLGKGILIWASANMLVGWVTGRFGFFGLEPEIPANVVLNYFGMGLCFFSAFLYVFVKSESQTRVDEGPVRDVTIVDAEPLLGNHGPLSNSDSPLLNDGPVVLKGEMEDVMFFERLLPLHKTILGTVAAVLAGIMYGANFIPVIYVQDHPDQFDPRPKPSKSGLNFVFAHFSGILLTSTVYFAIYCAVMKNKPRVYSQAILPGFVSGVMWAVADAAWFIANSTLQESVSFPIITAGPAMVGALWGILLFKEIQGLKNFAFLGVAFMLTITGAVLTGFSKGS